MAYDFKVSNRQIVVGDSFVEKEELNRFFENHKLVREGFSNKEICELIYEVALVYEDKMPSIEGYGFVCGSSSDGLRQEEIRY